jgi:HSP20 family molecular chaperone IbpA
VETRYRSGTAVTDKAQQPSEQYWVSERSYGEFAEHDDVQASMKNGILSVVIPKARKHEGRKITIS